MKVPHHRQKDYWETLDEMPLWKVVVCSSLAPVAVALALITLQACGVNVFRLFNLWG